MRTIIYTGKGGVGKTSLSAATGLASAALGHKTLIMSTDSAHSLGDSLDIRLGPDPVQVRPNLFGQEVDVLTEMERHWKVIQEYLASLLASQGVPDITAKEVVVLPGMELIAALLLFEQYSREKRYDVVIMDTAPTADTLRLLSFPDAMQWYFDHFLKLQRRVTKLVRPTVGRVMKTPMPSDNFFNTLEELYDRFRRVRALLTDPKATSVRLVLNPERMVITETQRAFTYLCLFGFPIEMLVVNRVLPAGDHGDFLRATQNEQAVHMATIREVFGDIPMRTVPRYSQEVVGQERLGRLATDVFGADDPTRIFATTHPVTFGQKGKRMTIRMLMPFTDPSGLDVSVRGDSLYVRVGGFKRTLLLPFAYVGIPVSRATLEDGALTVEFAAKPEAPRGR